MRRRTLPVSFPSLAALSSLLLTAFAPACAQAQSGGFGGLVSQPPAAGAEDVKADDTAPFSRLPVREVTVFKDGHAFVLHEGKLPVGAGGAVVLDDLPNPVLGTFWPYAGDNGVTIRSAVAARQSLPVTRDVTSLRELLAANVGARVRVEAQPPLAGYEATVLSAPTGAGQMVLLQTDQGIRPVNPEQLLGFTLLGTDGKRQTASSVTRDRLTLLLEGATSGGSANVGLMYLQKGLRWIPSYRVALDGKKGVARVALQATLINELVDLDGAAVHLVVGVPTFDFADTPDPIGLKDTFAQLSRYFQNDARTAYGLSNALAGGQGVRMAEYAPRPSAADGSSGGPPVMDGAAGEEDLFLFTVKNVRLKRNERMVVPVAEFTVPYKDVYTLEVLPVPPRELRDAYYGGGQPPAGRLLFAPKVQHQIRLKNASPYPLTTAPMLLLKNERVLAQGTVPYTARGAETDVPLTGAVNIEVTRSDRETKRTPSALSMSGYQYTQVDLNGKLCLTNFGTEAAPLEIKRYVLGTVTAVSEGGTTDTLDPLSEAAFPAWGGGYNWSGDQARVNGLGRASWKLTLAPGKSVDLTYEWRYFWR